MLNDLAWRKVPRNIIRDENIEYISSLLPEHLQAAPMLLYFIMYCKADDEGVIDLEDGAIYSRLMMKSAKPEEIIEIARLMAKRKLLIPVADGFNVYIIDDWDIPARPGVRTARTMEERRAAVAQKIRAEQAKKQSEAEAVNFDELRRAAPFFCPDFDKNAQNVVTEREEREIRENSESTGEKIEGEIKEKTHTEGNSGNFSVLPPVAKESMQENQRKTEQENPEFEKIDQYVQVRYDFLHDDAPQIERVQNSEVKRAGKSGDESQVYVVFKDFFAKNCLGFQEAKFKSQLEELAKCICLLQDDVNTAPVIANVFCQQFKLLTEQDGYFKGLPMFPAELLKPNVYRRVLSMASKILCNKKPINKTWIDQTTALNSFNGTNDRMVYDEYAKMLIQSGIDPNSESPLWHFLMKKATAIK